MDSKLCTLFFSLFLLQLTLTTESRAITERSTKEFRRSMDGDSSMTEKEDPPIPDYPLSDYSLTVFKELASNWREKECDTIYNCANVVKEHCTADKKRYIPPDNHPEVEEGVGCTLNFTLRLKDDAHFKAAELALFTNLEEQLTYRVYIFEYNQTSTSFQIGSRTMNSECGHWQAFNLSSTKLSKLQPGSVYTAQLLLVVLTEVENGFRVFSCEDIKKVFYIDSRTAEDFNFTTHNEYKRETEPAAGEEGSTKENKQSTEESASPTVSSTTIKPDEDEVLYDGTTKGATSSPTPKPDIEVTQAPKENTVPTHQRFLPVLTLFVNTEEDPLLPGL